MDAVTGRGLGISFARSVSIACARFEGLAGTSIRSGVYCAETMGCDRNAIDEPIRVNHPVEYPQYVFRTPQTRFDHSPGSAHELITDERQ